MAADVSFDHPGTHAVDDDERAGRRDQTDSQPNCAAESDRGRLVGRGGGGVEHGIRWTGGV